MISSALARKYAQAFLNVYDHDFDWVTVQRIQLLCDATKKHNMWGFLSWPVMSEEKKVALIRELIAHYDVPMALLKLVELLFRHKRAWLFLPVMQTLVEVYKERHAIATVTITSSHELDTHALEIIKQFLANATGKAIMYTYHVDKKLIAGIRAASDTFMWERSINKQLAMLRLPLIR